MSRSSDFLQIGDLAAQSGASARSLRHYEQQGLIRSVRTSSGYRLFEPDTVDTVVRIKGLLRLGLSLAEIGPVLPCFVDNFLKAKPCRDLQSVLSAQLQRIDETQSELARTRTKLANMLTAVS